MNTSQSNSKTILITEDDPLLVSMYKTKFENEGFNLVVADDGEKGLEIALKGGIDLIILDLMMPRLSGIEMLTSLRQHSKGKNIPVIVLTNLSEDEEVAKVKKLGVKYYLTKSDYTPGQLVEKVKECLN